MQQAMPALRTSVLSLADAARRAHPQLSQLMGAEDIEEMANAYFQRIYTSEQVGGW